MIRAIWRRFVRGSKRILEHPDWSAVAGAGWVDSIMTTPVTDRFHAKQGRSIGRWSVGSSGRQLSVYLKRHHRLPRLAGLLAALWPAGDWSRGTREWRHLKWAKEQGIPVPRALAAGEILAPWGRMRSFLAIEELAGMLPLHEAIPQAEKRLLARDFENWKRGLIAEMARLVRLLHERNHFHTDLYLCHFYVSEAFIEHPPANWHGQVYMIDFHRLTHRRVTAPFGRWKDLAQLLYSARVVGITDRDRIRFWHSYTSGRRLPLLRWAIVWKARQYLRHNQKRRGLFEHGKRQRPALEHRAVL